MKAWFREKSPPATLPDIDPGSKKSTPTGMKRREVKGEDVCQKDGQPQPKRRDMSRTKEKKQEDASYVEALLADDKAMDIIMAQSKQIQDEQNQRKGMGDTDLQIAQNIYEEYKKVFSPIFIVPAFHTCWPDSCRLTKVDACVRECDRFDRAESYHFCFYDKCPDKYDRRCHDGAIIKVMKDLIYVCSLTGTPHYCGGMCDRMGSITNEEHCFVCPLSGKVSPNREMKGDFWVASGETDTCADANTALKRMADSELKFIGYAMEHASDMNMYAKNYPKDMDKVFPGLSKSGALSDPRSRKTFEISMKNKYLRLAIEKISAMMSDYAKARYTRKNASKKTFTVSTSLEKYERSKSKSLEPLMACHIRNIVDKTESKIADMPNITMTKSKKNNLIVLYAKNAVQFWVVLVSGGASAMDRTKVPFFHFIDAYVKLACSGLHVNTSGVNSQEWIIKPDILLASLVLCDICPEVCDEKKSNDVRASVNKHVHSLVYNSSRSPESLAPESLDYNDITEAVFVSLRTPSAYSDMVKKKHKYANKSRIAYSRKGAR